MKTLKNLKMVLIKYFFKYKCQSQYDQWCGVGDEFEWIIVLDGVVETYFQCKNIYKQNWETQSSKIFNHRYTYRKICCFLY